MSAIQWLLLVSFCALIGAAYALVGPFVAVAVFWSVVLGSMLAGGMSQDPELAAELESNRIRSTNLRNKA
jgi:hypothetical protein